MIRIIKLAYKLLPPKTIRAIGRSKILKSLRSKILRPNNSELIIVEKIERYKSGFFFFAPIKTAVKAKNKGIENRLIRSALKLLQEIDQPIVFDVGANYGYVSLAICSELGSKIKIISFEPHPEVFKTFNQSIAKNQFNNIQPCQMAVGDTVNEVELNLSNTSGNILIKNNSNNLNKIKVNQTTLDYYIKENQVIPHLIKIDVDGYEMNVLKGLENTIKTHKPILIVEYNDNAEIVTLLLKHGYTLLDMSLKPFDQVPLNIFCVR